MPVLFLLALPFAGDADRLGHPDYPARAAAHARLRAVSLLAYPALVLSDPANPEAGERRAVLLDQCEGTILRWLASAAVCAEPTRAQAEWWAADDRRADLLAAAADRDGYWERHRPGSTAHRWVRPGWAFGDRAGDVLELLRAGHREFRVHTSRR